jgi:hypothetical protein
MAWTTAIKHRANYGNQHVAIYSCSADSTSEAFKVFHTVDCVMLGVMSMDSGSHNIQKNVLTAGTAAPGYVSVTGVAANDEFFLIVFGRD